MYVLFLDYINTDLSSKSKVTLTRSLTSGTKIGSITIDGQTYELYAPTDTNTWRGIQDNLTSNSATDSLSARQGKALKIEVGSKVSREISTGDKIVSCTGGYITYVYFDTDGNFNIRITNNGVHKFVNFKYDGLYVNGGKKVSW